MSINDVSDAFGEWLAPVVLTRAGAGSFVGGRWVPGATSEVTIQAVIQNATADDKQVLEEGQRSSESIKLHTTSDLVALSEDDKTTGDIFTYQSKKWQVVNVARRFIGNYKKGLAIRITPTP